ncbi:MAG: polyphosphate kinase 2 family protein [candidate division KSB1 bacterium]|jgi:PPK2 family polyphosphate:nucleotide phosphotransferase|nr:polyphosphate kinase 2 family protein [candidate division KSB1 bacterium]
MLNKYRVKPGDSIDLGRFDPNDPGEYKDRKKEAKEETTELNERLEELQELLYAEGKHKLLIVLQGMDTAGKDSTIRRVFDGVNPQGVKVASFKVPTDEELSHDYLWRVHQHVPGKGEITIFNRSHYEDVLVVRVHSLVPEKTWKKRYDHINQFERMLVDEGTTILKLYLHIDPDEQKERLQSRLDEAHKRWKFNPNDLKERKLWGDYTKAYEDVLNKTSTEWAPWFIIPSNRKWVRDMIISHILIETLEGLNMQYPQPADGLDDIVIE